MPDARAADTRAVVLGPGGVVGTAWLAGLAAGLHRAGVDLADADLIVGTSAGAIIGALLATGQDLERLAALPSPTATDGPQPKADPRAMGEVFALLGDAALDIAEKRRRAGRLALAAGSTGDQVHIARMRAMIGTDQWPVRRLLIPAVDAETGEPVVFDRDSGVPLPVAVASSTAFPGAYPPITANGRRYIDGALRAVSNADLAADAHVRIVIEPMARLNPTGEAGPPSTTTIVPDPTSLQAIGPDLQDRQAWEPAYQAGLRQAKESADRIATVWRPAT